MFDRLVGLIGNDNLNKLKNVHILLVGVGGVGGFAFESLVRSGIGNITVIDGDIIAKSNLNRQIISNSNNINEIKVEVAKKRALSINPNIKIDAKNIYINRDNIEKLGTYDYIIDACDDINAKLLLMKYAEDNNIKLISALGTGKRLNPQNVVISRLDKTINDPLAKKIRYESKKLGLNTKIPVVYACDMPLNNENTISSAIFAPSVAGIYLAYYVINDIITR